MNEDDNVPQASASDTPDTPDTPEADEEVLVYVPQDTSSHAGPFRWSIALGLIVLWLALLGFALFTKAGMFKILLPAIMVILIVYLGICSIYLLKASKS